VSIGSPEELNDLLTQIRSDLLAQGQGEAAAVLGEVQATAFTTGSEWLGELGRAVKEVRRRFQLRGLVESKLDRVMDEVRRVWPGL
jgi:hypothetical protein